MFNHCIHGPCNFNLYYNLVVLVKTPKYSNYIYIYIYLYIYIYVIIYIYIYR